MYLIANAKKTTPVTAFVRHEGELRAAGDALHVFPTGGGTMVWESPRTKLTRNETWRTA